MAEKAEQWADNELYRRMCEPMESEEAATESMKKFNAGIRALREECHIHDVIVVFQATVTTKDGEAELNGSIHIGCEAIQDIMLAKELGKVNSSRMLYLERLKNGEVD
jgi:hypothetical protein